MLIVHALTQQIFINCLLYIRYWARCGELNIDQDRLSFFPHCIEFWQILIIILFILFGQVGMLHFSLKEKSETRVYFYMCTAHLRDNVLCLFVSVVTYHLQIQNCNWWSHKWGVQYCSGHVCVYVLASKLCLTLCDPIACKASLTMGLSRQEYWSGLPFPSPGDLPNPGIEPGSPALQGDSLLSEPPGKPVQVMSLY